MRRIRTLFLHDASGLATVEYIVGAAVILGTLAIGVTSWNNSLVSRLAQLAQTMETVH
jgi:Flp pilus assembly pilin Flp